MTGQRPPNASERNITPSYPTPEMHFDNQWRSPLRFLWFCAGADRQYLERPECAVERNKYAGIGATVLLTSVFAMASGSYAWFFVFRLLILGVIAGILWAGAVFIIDRFVVQSIWKSRKQTFAWPSVVLRLVLAGLIATVISTPLELRIFQREIEAQLARDLQSRQGQQATASLTDPMLVDLNTRLKRLQDENSGKAKIRDEAYKIAMREANGQGVTGMVGKGLVYGETKDYWLQMEREYNQTVDRNKQEIHDLQDRIGKRESVLKTRGDNVAKTDQANDGLLRRLLALRELQHDPETGFTASVTIWVVFLLFLLVETMPLVSKLLTGFGPYNAALERAISVGILELDKKRELDAAYIEESTIHKLSSIKQVENAKSELLEGVLSSLKHNPEYQALTAEMALGFIEQVRREFGLMRRFDLDAIHDRLGAYNRSTGIGAMSSEQGHPDDVDLNNVMSPNPSPSQSRIRRRDY